MLVSERLKRLFGGELVWRPPAPWIQIKQDNGALLLVSPDGTKFHLIGPKVRFVETVESEEAYFSLYKRLGRDPNLWPENTGRFLK